MRSPKNTNKKNLLTDKHYQKFSISIISTSTSRNTNIAFPCKLCNKNINDSDAAIQSDICQFWVHLRCNKLNLVDYKYLQGSADPWFCLSCCSTILTFGNFTDKDLSYLVFIKSYIEISNKNSFDHLKPPPNGALLFSQFNNSSSEQQIDPENVENSRYFDIVQIYFQILHRCFWIESLWAPLWPPM